MYECRLEIKDKGTGAIELARFLLLNLGVQEQEISQQDKKGRLELSVFTHTYSKAKHLYEDLHLRLHRGVKLKLIALKDSDWKTAWKKYCRPFYITPGLLLIPAWLKRPRIKKGTAVIIIDTTSAFGSGLHPTTQMMAELIRQYRVVCGRFLDVGTGSGILAVIAAHYGAGEVWGIDSDLEAMRTARKNLRVNNCPGAVLKPLPLERFNPRRAFDFVAANLLTGDLIRMQERLKRCVKPSGLLAVSGIYHENYPFFTGKFRLKGFRRLALLQKKKWVALLYRRMA